MEGDRCRAFRVKLEFLPLSFSSLDAAHNLIMHTKTAPKVDPQGRARRPLFLPNNLVP